MLHADTQHVSVRKCLALRTSLLHITCSSPIGALNSGGASLPRQSPSFLRSAVRWAEVHSDTRLPHPPFLERTCRLSVGRLQEAIPRGDQAGPQRVTWARRRLRSGRRGLRTIIRGPAARRCCAQPRRFRNPTRADRLTRQCAGDWSMYTGRMLSAEFGQPFFQLCEPCGSRAEEKSAGWEAQWWSSHLGTEAQESTAKAVQKAVETSSL